MKQYFSFFAYQKWFRSVYVSNIKSVFLGLNFLLVSLGITSHRSNYFDILFFFSIVSLKWIFSFQINWPSADPYFKSFLVCKWSSIFIVKAESLASFSEGFQTKNGSFSDYGSTSDSLALKIDHENTHLFRNVNWNHNVFNCISVDKFMLVKLFLRRLQET